MKKLPCKKAALFCVSLFTLIAAFISAIIIASAMLPKVISYHPVTESKNVSAIHEVGISEDESYICPYDSVSEIRHSGPFIIKSENGHVFIFCDDIRLYRLKTSLESFPEADRNAIISGIIIHDKKELTELMQYLES